jgi:hypothetical protein
LDDVLFSSRVLLDVDPSERDQMFTQELLGPATIRAPMGAVKNNLFLLHIFFPLSQSFKNNNPHPLGKWGHA